MNLLHLEVREESESSSLEQEALKDQFLAGLADTTNRAKANLRNTVLRLLALGLSRKTLVDWAVTAKYSASYARGILSELLRRTEGRTRKPGGGRRTQPEAFVLRDIARNMYGGRARGFLRAAYRLDLEQERKESREAGESGNDHQTVPLILDQNNVRN
jgi:hypothetical protein